jgi:hypothetical protein
VSEAVQVQAVPGWLANLGWPDPAYTVKFVDPKTGKPFWESNPGPQTWMLLCPYAEILGGGSRGGGKSEAIAPWMAMGDPLLPDSDPAKYSYLNDPDFRGLILREQYQDLKEFVDRAMDFFRHFGCKPKDDPVCFEFKSGAKIYTGHLNNEDAYNKYRGWNLTKIAIEELTRIEKLAQYLRLFGSLRSVPRIRRGKQLPALRTQIFNTTNPDGPGAIWVKSRFIEVRRMDGKLAEWNRPLVDPVTKLTRIFIPARLTDNPYLASDNRYLGMLKSQDAVTQRQWIDGDWNAAAGTYFRDYRPHGPIGSDEPEWARHLTDSAKLEPWYTRWGSGDWGYDHPAAFHKFCINHSDHRVHVYDELCVRQVGSYELGALLARWWMPELESLPDHQVTIYLSPDAFSKTDASKTKAEQMEMGIKEILGPYGALLMRYNDEERMMQQKDPRAAAALFEYRKRQAQGQMCIALKPANTDRIAGWQYCRELLRWRPLLADTAPDMAHAKVLFERQGIVAYEKYLEQFRDRKPEVLPRIQIWRVCKELDRFLQSAVHDEAPRAEDVRKVDAENGKGGDDPGDSFRHGAMALKDGEVTMPKYAFMAEKMSEAETIYADPAILGQIAAFQSARYDQQHALPVSGVNLRQRPSMRRVQ